MIPKPVHKDVWTFDIDGKVYIEIVHWGVDREKPEWSSLNNRQGVWNYYCSIPERVMPTRFHEVWLPDELKQFSDASPFRVTHDYMNQPFADVEWHCGITFYDKIGQVEGHRVIKMGCDYSHLWDQERGFNYTIEEVTQDAIKTANELIALYSL